MLMDSVVHAILAEVTLRFIEWAFLFLAKILCLIGYFYYFRISLIFNISAPTAVAIGQSRHIILCHNSEINNYKNDTRPNRDLNELQQINTCNAINTTFLPTQTCLV